MLHLFNNNQPLNYYYYSFLFPFSALFLWKQMPTPVAAARQCLTQESAAVLDDAVGVARRRGHAQTTSLHMVSSLLSLPSSSLREACSRTRSNAYSTRVQFKALELSLSVSLDRLPSSPAAKHDEPPVSNSLMAAIKRSQANQRRQPENFSFYQQQQQQQFSAAPLVKVELQNLIVSILDDPLVSRVFGEAGFRSCDIKMATLRPGIGSFQVLGCTSRYKRPSPPLFLCNLTASEGDHAGINGGKGFSFPFMGCFAGDDTARRIGEVMLRDKKRCPLLLGISATDALTTFLDTVRGGGGGALPDGLSGLRVERVGEEILRYLSDGDEGPLKSRLEEVEGGGGGVVVDFGDLAALVGDGVAAERLKFLVGSLGRLVVGGKVWLIGVAAAYEVYFKILNRFPSIEEDWQLGVLPITSLKFAMGGSYPRSSLMESFVPLGGFFSLPPETNACQYVGRCHLCNDKYEQEVAAVSNGGEKHQSGSMKGTDDRVLLNAKISGLQKKWDGICQQHHLGRPHAHQVPPRVLGFQVRKGNDRGDNSNESSNDKNAESTHLQKSSSSLTSKSGEIVPPKMNPSTADDDRASPSSVTSVTTDLGLAIVDAFTPTISNDLVKDPKLLYRALLQRLGHQEEAVSSVVEAVTRGINRRNIWINVRGGDGLSKKKLGLAMAEVMYRSRESLIYVDLSFQEEVMMSQVDALFNAQFSNKYELTMRGTVVDYLVEKLSRKPAVVFLDNVDKADLVVQKTLLQAIRSGRFTDWCGREVSVSNCVFLGATRLSEGNEEDVVGTGAGAGARGSAMHIVVRFDLSDDDPTVNKRKLVGRGSDRSSIISGSSHEMAKRAHKASKSYLDLNLPAEGSEVCNVESESECGSGSESSRSSWMEELDREVDETVVFKQFDFPALEKKVLERVAGCLRDVVGCECAVEVEGKAMKQIVAAAYLYGSKVVEDWIESVVRQGFVEAMGKYSLSGRSIVRVDAVGEELPQPQPQGLLPARVAVK
ncbi:protein SMAX1-LIKE 6-like [Salvia miltiorrhiza]|uniref:protein SMAX1-LIKE 6-like n=1 Tax=Salvia miltiorrhiza TaxID=226208 RepID=UPI0025ACB906|nr:protein SMAX1-LIKE 6-like [Salvia miltiorrhiza]